MDRQESSRDTVLRVMSDGIPRTDAEIVAASGLSHNKASGARWALWEVGLVERLPKARGELMRWQFCPPERREEARLAFRDSTERRTRGRLQQKSPGERANIVIDLLSDDSVNE